MQIRLAGRNDVPEICGLYNEFFAYNSAQQPRYYQKSIETGQYRACREFLYALGQRNA